MSVDSYFFVMIYVIVLILCLVIIPYFLTKDEPEKEYHDTMDISKYYHAPFKSDSRQIYDKDGYVILDLDPFDEGGNNILKVTNLLNGISESSKMPDPKLTTSVGVQIHLGSTNLRVRGFNELRSRYGLSYEEAEEVQYHLGKWIQTLIIINNEQSNS